MFLLSECLLQVRSHTSVAGFRPSFLLGHSRFVEFAGEYSLYAGRYAFRGTVDLSNVDSRWASRGGLRAWRWDPDNSVLDACRGGSNALCCCCEYSLGYVVLERLGG